MSIIACGRLSLYLVHRTNFANSFCDKETPRVKVLSVLPNQGSILDDRRMKSIWCYLVKRRSYFRNKRICTFHGNVS